MAYPFGTTNDHICSLLAACGIRYARSVEVTNRFDLPVNPLNWACSCHHYDLEPLIDPFLARDGERKLLTVWGHAYEFDQKNEWEKIASQLQRLGKHSDVWYATNGEIFDYISDFNALDTTLDEYTIHNERAQTIWFKYNGAVMSIDAGATIHLPEMPINEHPFRIWKDA